MDISEYVFQVPFNTSAAPLSQLLTLLSFHIPTPLEGTELLPVITGGRLVYRVWPLPQALSPAEAREDGLVANTLTHGHGTLATFTQKGGRLHVAVGCIFILSLAQGGNANLICAKGLWIRSCFQLRNRSYPCLRQIAAVWLHLQGWF